ncbi:MAG: ABC transporter permease [Ardenticatenaceae bacterium]|nr:ABC transporter permease [Ardenticatenaceae bacterium]
MNIRRVFVLLGKELVWGPRNFMFIFALVVPVVLSLVLSLLFGTIFSGKPRLGIADAGDSRLVTIAQGLDGLRVMVYETADSLQEAVTAGAVDVGMALPAGFDASLQGGETTQLLVYVWGESLLRDRAVLASTIAFLLREIVGEEPPVAIVTTTLGEGESIAWEERLLPFVVLITVLVGGVMVPSTSLVEEKQKRTLTALTVTPTGLTDVFVAKGLLGVLLSGVMGVLILIMNSAFGTQPVLLVVLLLLGATMASAFGVLLGVYVKDVNTLFATIKGLGILLYAPAILYLFPSVPQWIGRLFPTYYIVSPIMEISQNNAGWSDIAPDVGILVLLILILFGLVGVSARRSRLQPA